jgi:hypothetical protein
MTPPFRPSDALQAQGKKSFQCAYCHVTLASDNVPVQSVSLSIGETGGFSPSQGNGNYSALAEAQICPECYRFTLTAHLYVIKPPRVRIGNQEGEPVRQLLKSWALIPEAGAKTYPSFIPEDIRKEYTEASLLRPVSARASAMAARRALQRIVRETCSIHKSSLRQEFLSIRDRVDPLLYNAIHNILNLSINPTQSAGSSANIQTVGSKLEADVNHFQDATEFEADKLLQLVELLLDQLYVERQQKESLMKKVVDDAHTRHRLKSELNNALNPKW